MGYSVKITAYSKADEQVLSEIEPHWWNAKDLLQDDRFFKSQNGRRYSEYDADLSLEEMRELHDRYKNNVTRMQKFLCFRFKRLSPPCRELHNVLHRSSHKYSRFRVNVFEWESGL